VRDVSSKFEQAGIPYMLTGSMAMNYYAQPRMTRDIDIVIDITTPDVASIIALFTEDYYVNAEDVRKCVAHRGMFNIIHNESVIKVDCIVRKPTDYRQREFERRRQIQMHDFTTFIVSKEDLIISKLHWAKDSHSEKQLTDVKNLLKTGYDEVYLKHWTHELGLDTLLEECLHD
jgi:hypothetical protein